MKPERDFALVLDECIDALQSGISLETILKQYPDKAERLSPLLQTAALIPNLPNPLPPKDAAMTSKSRLMEVLSEQKKDSQRLKKKVIDELGTGLHRGPGRGIILFVFSLVLVFILLSSLCVTASESLPGSPFYPIKLAMQDFRLMLILNPEERQRRQDFIYWIRQQDLLTAIEQARIPEAEARATLTAMPTPAATFISPSH